MDEQWLVFGGWAVAPDILRPLFGDKSIYIDINEMMQFLFDGEELSENWSNIVIEKVNEYLTMDIAGIAGWSTGAIIACTLAQRLAVKKLVLLSATPSFCRRVGFRFGQRPATIRAMIHKLKEKENSIVREFFLQCGWNENEMQIKSYNEQVLINGLRFLERVNLMSAIKKSWIMQWLYMELMIK